MRVNDGQLADALRAPAKRGKQQLRILFLPSKQGLQILIASIVLLSVCGEDVLPYHRVAQELSATFDRLRPADCGEEHCIWVLASIALNHSGNLLCCNLPPPCCKKNTADFVASVGAGKSDFEGAFLCIRRHQHHIRSRFKLCDSKFIFTHSLKPACESVVGKPTGIVKVSG